jgi:hypothetical protein
MERSSAYAKNLFNTTYADKIREYSVNNAYYKSYLNALDKQEKSIHLKLTTLVTEISRDNMV